MLQARQISLKRTQRWLLSEVSLTLSPGTVHALLGGNGAGKSSLLKAMAGELRPDRGEVVLDDRPLASYSATALAQRRAVLPQIDELRFAFTSREVAALGRLRVNSGDSATEHRIITECLEATDASHLAQASYTQLSGGERARVQLARVLAQVWGEASNARYLLLDEPTASLDIGHQHACLQLCRKLAAQGLGVLVVLHDLNLAAHYADRVSLMHQGRLLCSGETAEVMTPELLGQCFGGNLQFSRVQGLGRLQLFAEYRSVSDR